eukprot:14055427-Alexandrium_andersonii.AAC.1
MSRHSPGAPNWPRETGRAWAWPATVRIEPGREHLSRDPTTVSAHRGHVGRRACSAATSAVKAHHVHAVAE